MYCSSSVRLCLFIITLAKSGISELERLSNRTASGPTCDGCPPDCSPDEPFENNGPVQLFKSANNTNKIYCSSPNAMRWDFGWDSEHIPLNGSTNKYFRTSSHKSNSSSSGDWHCISLEVIYWSRLWSSLPFFVKCTRKSGKGSRRWYRLAGRKSFDPQDISKEPKRTKSITELNLLLFNHKTNSHFTFPPGPVMTSTVAKVEANRSDRSLPTTTSSMKANKDLKADLYVQNGGPTVGKGETSEPPSGDRTTIYAVAGGAAACVTLLLILVVFLIKKVKCQRKAIEITKEEIDEFTVGVAAEKAKAKGINGLFVLPYDTRLEIPKSDVNFLTLILGSGAFGQVVKGSYRGSPVAIKTLKNNGSQSANYLRSLLGELKVMSYLGSHPNLVALIGAITRNIKRGEVYLIFEYCSNGNAHSFVRGHRENFVNMLVSHGPASNLCGTAVSTISALYGTARLGVSLSTKDLVRWAYEVSSGMEYVSAQNVYHGDLAARNILLTENLTAKVGDFGLSKQLDVEKYTCYVQRKECPLPLKWMAIESLRDLTFSIQSDVWSYGVTLWEFFTLGSIPYPGIDWNFESWKLLCEGKRLAKPEYASDSIYDIMMKCWDADPKLRPGFGQLKELMHKELQKF